MCRNREDCANASEHIFYVENCVTASEKLCAAASEYIFLCWSKCVVASEIISMFFNERATASERKCAATSLELCPLFWSEKSNLKQKQS